MPLLLQKLVWVEILANIVNLLVSKTRWVELLSGAKTTEQTVEIFRELWIEVIAC